MRKSEQMQIGKAGEYLVCADLILKGFIAFPSEQGLPYDVLLDTGDKLLKVQVKTTTGLRVTPQRKHKFRSYIFNIKRHGKNNKQYYSLKEVDLFGLVCLDTKNVGYIENSKMPTSINIRADELRGKYYDEKGIDDFQKVKELEKIEKNQTKIAKQLNLHVAQVNRMLRKGYKPHKTNAKYFTDFIRNKKWFYQFK